MLDEFRKEFPEIKIFSTNGAGNSLGTRIVAEARAGNVLADLYSGGAVTNFEILYKGKVLGSLKSALILPEVLDQSKWYGGKHCYNDAEQQHVFIYLANPTSTSLYFNTNLVNPKDFKSYWDLVTPKWKGKYVSQEPTSTGIGPSLQFFFYHPRPWAGFFKKTLHRSCSPFTAGTGAKSRIGWRKENLPFASAAAILIEPRSRVCPWTIWTWWIGRKVCQSLPAVVR